MLWAPDDIVIRLQLETFMNDLESSGLLKSDETPEQPSSHGIAAQTAGDAALAPPADAASTGAAAKPAAAADAASAGAAQLRPSERECSADGAAGLTGSETHSGGGGAAEQRVLGPLEGLEVIAFV